MKIVYVVHVEGSKKEEEAVLIPGLDPGDILDEHILEEIFMAHNMSTARRLPALTGYSDNWKMKDYVVDVDNFVAYACEPSGWRVVK